MSQRSLKTYEQVWATSSSQESEILFREPMLFTTVCWVNCRMHEHKNTNGQHTSAQECMCSARYAHSQTDKDQRLHSYRQIALLKHDTRLRATQMRKQPTRHHQLYGSIDTRGEMLIRTQTRRPIMFDAKLTPHKRHPPKRLQVK